MKTKAPNEDGKTNKAVGASANGANKGETQTRARGASIKSIDMAKNTSRRSTLDQLGLGPASHNRGTASSCDGERIATEAICHLVESGRVSLADAQAAVVRAKGTNPSRKKTRKEASPPGVHRTRHVALKFSYDGSQFTGFAGECLTGVVMLKMAS